METWGLILVVGGVAVFVLLLLRELFCWYAKTNKILRVVEEIRAAMVKEEPVEEQEEKTAAAS